MNRKVALSILFGGLGIGIFGVTALHISQSVTPSPYANQSESPIRGLSPQEVDDLLNGSGAGYARMAELNSYPGPRHVLDFKNELALSPSQEQVVQTTFDDMQNQAQQLGKTIVDRENQLSQAFAENVITAEQLQQQTQDLANLYGELRAAHLQAHLEITPILSAQQIERYDQLRGYTESPSTAPHHH